MDKSLKYCLVFLPLSDVTPGILRTMVRIPSFLRFTIIAVLGTATAFFSIAIVLWISALHRTPSSIADTLPLDRVRLYLSTDDPATLMRWHQRITGIQTDYRNAEQPFTFAMLAPVDQGPGFASVTWANGKVLHVLNAPEFLEKAQKNPKVAFSSTPLFHALYAIRAQTKLSMLVSYLPPLEHAKDGDTLLRALLDNDTSLGIAMQNTLSGTVLIDGEKRGKNAVPPIETDRGIFAASLWQLLASPFSELQRMDGRLAEGLQGIVLAMLMHEGLTDTPLVERILAAPASIVAVQAKGRTAWVMGLTITDANDRSALLDAIASADGIGTIHSPALPDKQSWDVVTEPPPMHDIVVGTWKLRELRPTRWSAVRGNIVLLATDRDALDAALLIAETPPQSTPALFKASVDTASIDSWLSVSFPFLVDEWQALTTDLLDDATGILHLTATKERSLTRVVWSLEQKSSLE